MRHLRAMTAALACVTTAFTAHAMAGGRADAAAVVTTFVISGAVAWTLAGVRVSRAQLLGLLVLAQAGVHLASMATVSSGPEHAMGASMLLAHVAATAVSLLLLARGEAFAWAIAERLALRPLAVLRTLDVPAVRRLAVAGAQQTLARAAFLQSHPVRGPPTKLAFAVPSL